MNITYSINNPVKAESLIDVFKSVGWKKSKLDIVQAFENSYYVTAWDGKQLVGFARAISDKYYYTNIFDVVVRPKYQKKGIAKAMLNLILEEFEGTYFYLSYTEGNKGFYAKCGFKENARCMFIQKEGPSKATEELLNPKTNPFDEL
ncbi:MAG: GNAT family N-acetyltransferase [Candidatus Zophobacter franzmannii]|jgi:GNAT superfamily N-acetyltransferase|nr:GNAT family N-acetyltransferase [Candidatus Zophobacter franzmannii]